MITEWTKETFTSKPLVFVKLNDDEFLQRRNIVQISFKSQESSDLYSCESRIISKDVYKDIILEDVSKDFLNVESNQFDTMEAITDLYSEQEKMKSDQTDMMEAIADIYAILEGGGV